MEELILSLLEAGPKSSGELLKLLGIRRSKRRFYSALRRLIDSGKIIQLPLKQEFGFSSLFCVPQHYQLACALSGFSLNPKLPIDRQQLSEIIQALKLILGRNPDLEELLLELKLYPGDKAAASSVFSAALELGWRPPDPDQKQFSKYYLQLLRNTAEMVRSGKLKLESLDPQIAQAVCILMGKMGSREQISSK